MNNKLISGFAVPFIVVILAGTIKEVKAQDWPQWLGPNRDGVSAETGLNLDWSMKKPSLLC